jgi:hypothetical protein
MRRRDFIAVLGLALFGGAATLWRNLASFWQPRFDEHTAHTVKVVTDLMFPGDGGLPGATELKIHDRVIAMEDLHEAMAYGVGWLDSSSMRAPDQPRSKRHLHQRSKMRGNLPSCFDTMAARTTTPNGAAHNRENCL